jgi:hypothetical protein
MHVSPQGFPFVHTLQHSAVRLFGACSIRRNLLSLGKTDDRIQFVAWTVGCVVCTGSAANPFDASIARAKAPFRSSDFTRSFLIVVIVF